MPRTGSARALTGAQSSSVSRVAPSSAKHSRASKYNHWSRGRNFLVMAWGERSPVSFVASEVPLYPTPALLPGPAPGRQVLLDSHEEHDQWDPRAQDPRPTHLQHLLGRQGPDDGGHGAQVPRAHAGEGSHDVFV